MECYIKFLSSVTELLAQVCLPMIVGQNRMTHEVPVKCEQITCTSMSV
jgi:hypothetical protein